MASNISDANAVISGLLESAFPSTPIAFPDTPFIAPSSAQWLRLSIVWGDGDLATMGATNRNTIVGVVQVEVYTPPSQGDGANTRLADQVRDVYNRLESSGVRFNVPSAPIHDNTETAWCRRLIRVPFTFDETV